MKNLYLRVGTTYYKKSLYPSLNGDSIEILVVWSSELIRQDHGRNTLSEIERYDGFICIPENRPEYFKKSDLLQLKSWTKYSIKKASHILTISESSKKDIVKNYTIDPHLITTTYLGYDTETFKPVTDDNKIAAVLNKYGFKHEQLWVMQQQLYGKSITSATHDLDIQAQKAEKISQILRIISLILIIILLIFSVILYLLAHHLKQRRERIVQKLE